MLRRIGAAALVWGLAGPALADSSVFDLNGSFQQIALSGACVDVQVQYGSATLSTGTATPTLAAGVSLPAGGFRQYTCLTANLYALGTGRLSVTPNVGALGSGGGGGGGGAVTQGTSPWVDNVTQLGGIAIALGAGASNTGTQRVVLSSDSGVGITGTLPAFAATPTVNLGTLNGAATSAKQDSIITALGSPLQAGGNIGTVASITGALPADAAIIGAIIASSGSAASYALTPVVASASAGVLAKSIAGNLYGAYAKNNTATAGFLALYNATALPASGASLTPALILDCVPLPANAQASVSYLPGPAKRFSAGIAALVSSTDCGIASPVYTTGSVTAYISAMVN